jgi:hypothetical protein
VCVVVFAPLMTNSPDMLMLRFALQQREKSALQGISTLRFPIHGRIIVIFPVA